MIFCIVYYAYCTYCELVYLIGTYIVQGFDMKLKKLLSTALTFIWDPASVAMKLRMHQVIFFWLIQDFVLKFWNMHYFSFSFGWWYTLKKKKHQISLYSGLKKMANILQIKFSNGFSFKKITVCLSVCACHTFFTMFPSWYHHEIFRSDYQW